MGGQRLNAKVTGGIRGEDSAVTPTTPNRATTFMYIARTIDAEDNGMEEENLIERATTRKRSILEWVREQESIRVREGIIENGAGLTRVVEAGARRTLAAQAAPEGDGIDDQVHRVKASVRVDPTARARRMRIAMIFPSLMENDEEVNDERGPKSQHLAATGTDEDTNLDLEVKATRMYDFTNPSLHSSLALAHAPMQSLEHTVSHLSHRCSDLELGKKLLCVKLAATTQVNTSPFCASREGVLITLFCAEAEQHEPSEQGSAQRHVRLHGTQRASQDHSLQHRLPSRRLTASLHLYKLHRDRISALHSILYRWHGLDNHHHHHLLTLKSHDMYVPDPNSKLVGYRCISCGWRGQGTYSMESGE